jgi:hypothetical protein
MKPLLTVTVRLSMVTIKLMIMMSGEPIVLIHPTATTVELVVPTSGEISTGKGGVAHGACKHSRVALAILLPQHCFEK